MCALHKRGCARLDADLIIGIVERLAPIVQEVAICERYFVLHRGILHVSA